MVMLFLTPGETRDIIFILTVLYIKSDATIGNSLASEYLNSQYETFIFTVTFDCHLPIQTIALKKGLIMSLMI